MQDQVNKKDNGSVSMELNCTTPPAIKVTEDSIVAFQHITTLSLAPTQLQELRDLGFELPPASGPLKLQGEIGEIEGNSIQPTESDRNGAEADGTEVDKSADGTKANTAIGQRRDTTRMPRQKKNKKNDKSAT